MRIHVTIAATGASWDLPLERFAGQLTAHRPDALIAVDPENPRPQVRFELTLGGQQAEGAYYTGQWQQLICWDGTIDAWSPVIEWFLGLLPAAAAAETFLESVARPHPLPRPASAADISRILTGLDNSV
jgi:hypothetical protein